jgi:hypothetical protein
MTDASKPTVQVVEDLDSASGDGDHEVLPEHHEHAIMNRRLDEDAV